MIKLTRHAEVRSNQRGIRPAIIEILLDFGASKIRHGREVIFMDRVARWKARETIGRTAYAQVEKALNKYVVLTPDGRVLTCAHRLRSLRS